MNTNPFRILPLLFTIALFSPPVTSAGADDPPHRITTRTEAVRVDFVTRGKDGRFIDDLTQSEVRILIDGQPRPVQSLTLVRPADRTAARESDPKPAPDSAPQPLLVLLIDMTAQHANLLPVAKHEIARYLATPIPNRPKTLLATFGQRLEIRQPFTDDPALLRRALDQISQDRHFQYYALAHTDDYLKDLDLFMDMLVASGVDLDSISGMRGHLVHADLRVPQAFNDHLFARQWANLCGYLSLIPSRKTAVMFTANPSPPAPHTSANMAQISFYPIHMQGLQISDNPGTLPAHTTTVLARNTGGVAMTQSNTFQWALQRATEDAQTYWVASCALPDDGRTVPYRKLDIRVSRRNVNVSARTSFRAKAFGDSAALAMLSAIRFPSLHPTYPDPLAVTSTEDNLNLALSVSHTRLDFLPAEGGHACEIEVCAALLDPSGSIPADSPFPIFTRTFTLLATDKQFKTFQQQRDRHLLTGETTLTGEIELPDAIRGRTDLRLVLAVRPGRRSPITTFEYPLR